MKNLGPFFLHVDLFRIPIAKLTVIYPILRLGITREGQHILTVRTSKAKSTFTVFDSALIHAFARSTLIR